MGANGGRSWIAWPSLLSAFLWLTLQWEHNHAAIQEASHLSAVENMLLDIKDMLENFKDTHIDNWSAQVERKLEYVTIGIQDLNFKFSKLSATNDAMEEILNKIEHRLETTDYRPVLYSARTRTAPGNGKSWSESAPEHDERINGMDGETLLQVLVPKMQKLLQTMEGVESLLWKSSLTNKLGDAVSLIRKLTRRLNKCNEKVNNSGSIDDVSQFDDRSRSVNIVSESSTEHKPEFHQPSCHGYCKQYALELIRKLVELNLFKALHSVAVDSAIRSMTPASNISQSMQKDTPFRDAFDEDDDEEEDDDDVLYDKFFRIQASASRSNNDFFDRDDIIPLLRRLWKKLSSPTMAIKEKLDSIVEIVTNRSSQACDQALRKFSESVSRYSPPFSTDSYSEDMLRILDHKISYVRNLYDRMEAAQTNTHVACNKALTEVERLASTLRNELPPPVSPPRRKPPSFPPRDCEEVQRSGAMTSGVYSIKPEGAKEKFSVYCDLRTDGGGWTVFQRRGDYGEPRQNFTLGWGAYKYGFGNLNEEFWLGNEKIHWLTAQDDVKLRVELHDFEGTYAYAEYSRFRVLDEGAEYQLNVGDYNGNASDSFSLHDGKLFSTFDRDNDEVSSCCNCADTFKGGWWYYKCFEANLNGPYHTNPIDNGYFQGIIWEKWKGDYSLMSAEMKLRPLGFDQWKDP